MNVPPNQMSMKLPLLKLALYKLAFLMLIVNTITSAQMTASLAMLQSRSPEPAQAIAKPLKDVLNELEREYKVYFTFESSVVKGVVVNREVSPSSNIDETLQQVLFPLNLNYQKISNNYYSIFRQSFDDQNPQTVEPKTKIDSAKYSPPQQEESAKQISATENQKVYRYVVVLRVSGKITDESGVGMPGVNIVEKGTTNGTTTDADGNYVIEVTNENSVLSISFVGYAVQEEVVGNRTEVNVQMIPDIKTLAEVVVIGYGAQEKKNLTAAVSTVNNADLVNRPVTNMSQALQGLAPNLTIQQSSGDPGSVPTINIRGVSSFTNNAPLIMVDGINVGQIGLNNLNPNDVESVSVLKDAASAAIYGSQAGNGVIYITTKKGKNNDKVSVQYSGLYGWQSPTASPKAVEGWEFMTLKNEALNNSGLPPQFTPTQIAQQRAKGSYPWAYDQLVNNTVPQQNHNLSVTGGNQSTTYLLSVGYMDQQSFFNGSLVPADQRFYNRRLNLRSNISTQISKYVRADVNLAYTNGQNRNHSFGDQGILIRDAMRQPRIYPIIDSLGNFAVAPLTSNNVFALLTQGGFKLLQSDNLLGMLNLNIKPIDGLSIDLNSSINYSIFNQQTQIRAFKYAPAYTAVAPPQLNEQFRESWRDMISAFFATVSYEKNFDKHFGKVMVGYRNDYFSDDSYMGTRNYNGTVLDNRYMAGGGFNTNSSGVIQGRITDYVILRNPRLKAINSLFGRLNYAYGNRYLAEFSWRYDGASILAPESRWFFFPSISLGWNITNEQFMEGIKEKIGDVKFRYSIGQLGNSNIDGYEYLARVSYAPGAYNFNNNSVQGTLFSPVNPELQWEKTTMSNYGIDFSSKNNMITASFDYWNRTTDGIYFRPNVPGALGISSPLQNFAKVQSVGWDFTLGARLKTGEMDHQFSVVLGDNANKIITLGPEQILGAGSDLTYINREGFPIGSYYVYQSNGLYQNLDDLNSAPQVPFANNQEVKPGDIRYVDRDENGTIEENDRYIAGNPFPRHTFGFTYGTAWKNFDFQMFWQGVGKREQFLRGDIVEAFHNNEDHAFVQHKDRWTPTNPDATYPRLTSGSALNLNNIAHSDYWLFDTKYLRLKNIQVGYTLPKALIGKIHLENVRVFVSAQNLLTFTPERFAQLGVDPEFTSFDNSVRFDSYNQVAGRNYPNAKTVSVGIDIKF
jgi:TonB-linked SusC/RagA family outer membrane protein